MFRSIPTSLSVEFLPICQSRLSLRFAVLCALIVLSPCCPSTQWRRLPHSTLFYPLVVSNAINVYSTFRSDRSWMAWAGPVTHATNTISEMGTKPIKSYCMTLAITPSNPQSNMSRKKTLRTIVAFSFTARRPNNSISRDSFSTPIVQSV